MSDTCSREVSLKVFDLYVERKLGAGNRASFFISASLPALLIMLVSLLLVVSLTFITSMALSMEEVMVGLGCGHLLVDGIFSSDDDIFYSVDAVRTSEALAFSGKANAALYLKGVDFQSYFNQRRLDCLNLESVGDDGLLNPVYLSSSVAGKLGVEEGGRFSVLVHDARTGRTRPLLLTCAGIFSSGYGEFDSTLCYVGSSLLSGDFDTEVMLADPSDIDGCVDYLSASGYHVRSYKDVYSDLYGNVEFSLDVLYGVFIVLALLAALFSSNIAFDYVSRDKRDIAALLVMGLAEKDVRRKYLVITLFFVLLALVLGLVLGLVVSFFIPDLMRYLEKMDFAALDAYMTSFSITIPAARILLMLAGLFVSSSVSLFLSLRKTVSMDISSIIAAG